DESLSESEISSESENESDDSAVIDSMSESDQDLPLDRKLTWTTPHGANLAELSDSDDEEGPLRRTGAIPEHWYEELDHLGYNIDGRPITRNAAAGAIDKFLQSQTKEGRRTIYDAENDANVVLSKKDIALLKRIRDGCYAHAEFDETSETFRAECPKFPHPLGNTQ
ncbi:hypothetical protein BVRB_038720, partial [Beta vulgaris subsp. vulgaris]